MVHMGTGGFNPMMITAGIEKLSAAPVPTMAASGTARLLDGGKWTSWTLFWSGIGIACLISGVL